jgi:cytochrome c biogenesis protein CcmG, thiol:disulfide interchange protein DsbE
MRTIRIMLLIGCLLLLLGTAVQALESASLPDFSANDLTGKRWTKTDFLGKGPVIIAFWAVWCKPCRKELNAYTEMFKTYKDKGLQVIAISIDGARKVADVQRRANEEKYPFQILLDPDGELRKSFGGEGVPAMFLADKDGKIIYQHTGYQPGDEKEVETALEKQFTTPSH